MEASQQQVSDSLLPIQRAQEAVKLAMAEVRKHDALYLEKKTAFHKSVADAQRKLRKLERSHRKEVEACRPYFVVRSQLQRLKAELRAAADRHATAEDCFRTARSDEWKAASLLGDGRRDECTSLDGDTENEKIISYSTHDSNRLKDVIEDAKVELPVDHKMSEASDFLLHETAARLSEELLSCDSTGQDGRILELRDELSSASISDMSDVTTPSLSKSPRGSLDDSDVELCDIDLDAPVADMKNALRDSASGTLSTNDCCSDDLNDSRHDDLAERLSPRDQPDELEPAAPIGAHPCDASVTRQALLENWNTATARVFEASKRRQISLAELQGTQNAITQLQLQLGQLESTVKAQLPKAMHVFQIHEKWERELRNERDALAEFQLKSQLAKDVYGDSLLRLELLSSELEQRQCLQHLRDGNLDSKSTSQLSGFTELQPESLLEKKSTCVDWRIPGEGLPESTSMVGLSAVIHKN